MIDGWDSGSDHTVARFAAITADIARTLESPAGVDERIHHALSLMWEVVPFDACGLLRVDSTGATHVITAPARSVPVAAFEHRLLQIWMLLQGEGGTPALPIAATTRIALPVAGEDTTLGVLLVEREGGDPYLPHHVRMISAVAAQFGGYLSLLKLADDQRDASLLVSNVDAIAVDTADDGAQSVPLSCPQCRTMSGYPYRARTKVGNAGVLSVGSRCRECRHEWEADMRTNAHHLFGAAPAT
jgi:hypothetical protein